LLERVRGNNGVTTNGQAGSLCQVEIPDRAITAALRGARRNREERRLALLCRKRKETVPTRVVARLRRRRCGKEATCAEATGITTEIAGFAVLPSDDTIITTDREASQVWTWVVISCQCVARACAQGATQGSGRVALLTNGTAHKRI
jgi:hypothetical protein